MRLYGSLAAIAAGLFAWMTAPTAHACGGCFAPTGQPSVVTAHRMAVAINTQRTILWDQFEYAGSPEDFVWVLPVAGGEDVSVELADNAFFLALQEQTQVTLQGPWRSTGGGGGGFGCGAAADSAGTGPSSRAVEVHHEGTVGPYETATISSDDPMALYDWMNERGYQVPEALLPTIGYYVEQGMSFVALRLSPGESVTRMQPVRVSSPGMNVSFPLRMVAAGVGDFVSLELFIIAEGRYEAANFPNATIPAEELVYDWATESYNYDEVAAEVLRRDANRTWLTEYADLVSEAQMRAFRVTDEAGETHTAADDWTLAVGGLAAPTVTRMRAELPVQALSEDLVLAASFDPPVSGFIQVNRDVNWETASLGGALTGRSDDTAMASLPVVPLSVLGLLAGGLAGRRLRRRRRG